MFSKWIVESNLDIQNEKIRKINVNQYDHLRFTPTAQLKFANSVSTPTDYYIVKLPKYINLNKPILSIGYKKEYKLYLSELDIKKGGKFNILIPKIKWICGPENNISKPKFEKLKTNLLKETIKFTGGSKAIFENYFKKVTCEFIPSSLEIKKPNKLLINVPYSTFSLKSFVFKDYITWIPNNDQTPKNILEENLDKLDIRKLTCFEENVEFIPKGIFYGDYLETEILLPLNQSYENKNINKLIKSKWKLKSSVQWDINEFLKNQIFDEPIRQIEIKYKVPIKNFEISHSYSYYQNQKNNIKMLQFEKWNFSKYKTYMMNWKPFGEIALEDVLNEDCKSTTNIIIPSMALSEEERYIKMSDLEKKTIDFIPKTDNYIKIPVETLTQEEKYPQKIKLNQSNFISEQRVYDVDPILDKYNDNFEDDLDDITINQLLNSSAHCYDNINGFTVKDSNLQDNDIQKIENENTTTQSMSNINSNSIMHNSIITSPKRTVSELDSIVMKKRQRTSVAQFDFGKKYPYLDILNQTTVSNVYPIDSPLINPTPQTSNNIELNNNFDNDFLEITEIKDEECILKIPEGKVCNIMLNIKFAEKFGAAYNKFNIMIDKYDNIDFNEYEMKEYKLGFDMFLNPTCGVLFFRPINVYQIDIKTGENMVIKQMSEIASQVLSLIVIIAIDSNFDISIDIKLTKFMEQIEDFGIQLFVISNEPKTIAISMFELIQQYSIFEDESYQWSPEHRFLENCGICNPFLTDWLLSNCTLEEFVEMSLEDRTIFLLRVCTTELTNQVNKAVQHFLEME